MSYGILFSCNLTLLKDLEILTLLIVVHSWIIAHFTFEEKQIIIWGRKTVMLIFHVAKAGSKIFFNWSILSVEHLLHEFNFLISVIIYDTLH